MSPYHGRTDPSHRNPDRTDQGRPNPGHVNLMLDARTSVTAGGALRLRGFEHIWGTRTLIMGIVNVTPDSFSGDGILQAEDATRLAVEQLNNGAQIIDIGGESTRPGYQPVSVRQELERVLPVIIDLRLKRPEVIISIDTTKPEVLRQAVGAGADMLNSIWGLTDELIPIVQEFNLPLVIMHNQEKPIYDGGDVVEHVSRYLSKHAESAVNAGIKPEHIILDPGIGFGKLPEHNIQVLTDLSRIVGLGFPTLLGTSRKSFIGHLTGQPVDAPSVRQCSDGCPGDCHRHRYCASTRCPINERCCAGE